MNDQPQLLHATRTEIVWRGAALGAMRGGIFCVERFSMGELQELVNVLLDELSPRRRTIAQLIDHVCADLGVSVDAIYAPRRQTDRTIAARNLSVFFAHGFYPSIDDTELAQIFQRTRTSMSHARSWVIDRRNQEKAFEALYQRLRTELMAKLFPKHQAA